MVARPKKMADILIDRGLITVEQLQRASDEQRRLGRTLGRVLVTWTWSPKASWWRRSPSRSACHTST
ncbi:MAG: hypothetical protein ACXV5Q_17080 [Frankiaceae bacterium]